MNSVKNGRGTISEERAIALASDLGQVANDLCEKVLNEAKGHLHPLLRSAEVQRLDQRSDFLQAFKSALEQRIARKLAAWQPGVQAVFAFDKMRMEDIQSWDGSVHLLVKVPRLSDTIKTLGKMLDRSLVKYLAQMSWSRFQDLQSILEVQQVTPNELRHGVSYGAMFYAAYTVPIKICPQNKQTS
jgi:hypothetical protein